MRLTEWVVAHRRLVVWVNALLLAAALPGLLRLRTDNTPGVFLPRDPVRLRAYDDLRAAFGNDEFVRVVLSGEGLWTREGLAWAGALQERAGTLPGVREVMGPRLPGLPWPPPDPAAVRALLRASPLERGLGRVDREGALLSLVVETEPLTPETTQAVVHGLEQWTARPPEGISARIVGGPVLNDALDVAAGESGRVFLPVLAVFAVLLLGATLRRPALVLISLVFVADCEALVFGAMGWAGVRMNIVVSTLPPVLFAIALATAVHILARFRDFAEGGHDAGEAVRATWREKGRALFWTSATTFVGFGSLAWSDLAAIRTLGLMAGIGIAWMTLASYTLLPALLAGARGLVGRKLHGREERWIGATGGRIAAWVTRRPWPVLAVSGVILLAAAAGLPRLSIESNAVNYFPPTHPVRADAEDLEAHGVGVVGVQVLLRGAASPEGVGRLAERLRAEPLVLGAVGPEEVRGLYALRLAGIPGPDPDEAMRRFVTADGRTARVILLVRQVGFEELDPLVARIRAVASEELPGVEAIPTGQYVLLMEAQRRLFRTLALSFGSSIVLMGFVFRYLVGGMELALIALIPNVWPILVVLGGMGWMGVRVDIATVMVASIVIGLAVDDTIHTLTHLRSVPGGLGRDEAVGATLRATAPAYILTGAILGVGFGSCALSHFGPTERFGVLAASAMGLAVLADLVMVPALLGAASERAVRRLRG